MMKDTAAQQQKADGENNSRATKRWRASMLPTSNLPQWKVQANKLQLKDLTILKKLGAGGFGLVSLEKHQKTGQLYAVKRVNREKLVRSNMLRKAAAERDVLSMVDTPFIIR